MLTLIGLEIKKLLLRKKTLITTIAFLLLIVFVAIGSYSDERYRRKMEKPEFQIQKLEETIKYKRTQLNDPKIEDEYKKSISNQIAQMEEQIKQIKTNPNASTIDWKKQTQMELDNAKKEFERKDLEPRQKEAFKNIIQEKEYLLKHNIKPDNNKLTAFSFLDILFIVMGVIFLAVGVGLFTADMVSGECTPPTMKLLLTQPVSRRKVLLSKFIAVAASATIMVVAIELISFVIMGLIFGFGDFNYPMFVGTTYKIDMGQIVDGSHPLVSVTGSTYMITRGAYLVRLFLLQTLSIIAVAAFTFMISSIFKSSMVSVSLSIVTPVVLFILSEIPPLGKFNTFMFTNHLNPRWVIRGELAMRLNNSIITPAFSIILLAIWTVACYAISHLVFTKKDILI